MNPQFQKYLDVSVTQGLQYLPQLLLALVTLVMGFWLVRIATKAMRRAFQIQRMDRSLASFLESASAIVLKIMLLITVAMMIGVQMTSFVALLGAAGLAVGLSLQGSLSNVAGGILILLFKPFKIGEEIEAQTQKGIVEKIEIVTTHVRGPDGRLVIIPNGILSNGVITNHSRPLPK